MNLKNIIRIFLQKYTNSKIEHILKEQGMKYSHDNNSLESEFRIKNRFYGMTIRFSKVYKGMKPKILINLKSESKDVENMHVELTNLKRWIERNV